MQGHAKASTCSKKPKWPHRISLQDLWWNKKLVHKGQIPLSKRWKFYSKNAITKAFKSANVLRTTLYIDIRARLEWCLKPAGLKQ